MAITDLRLLVYDYPSWVPPCSGVDGSGSTLAPLKLPTDVQEWQC